ncbi:uncharacterized protein LOC132266728 [Cornus florida]|uniref:uncharacterized protein LOC132266728 n=1 Tax=Cornus florida TaxID=4283 RepID=UPI0028A27421|nr:uncharacterized protein LOC132266728 [Cornus florida]
MWWWWKSEHDVVSCIVITSSTSGAGTSTMVAQVSPSSELTTPPWSSLDLIRPMPQIEKSSLSTTDSPTSLNLSLPESDSCEVSNQVFGSHQVTQPTQLAPSPPSLPVIVHQLAPPPPPMVAHSGQNFEFGAPTTEKQFFSQEFLSVMQ